ncbi:hypothetical protein B0T17DRAFT_517500 [Bombardia bombarda]|uniref:Uncharacterized protein n=1 Tax=Bombardia bombarda TaxID=252184 RepID=A0AA40CFS7_9PEZI|nr:hypothetical protein B0T17DRAFT_517500 [Bombardia bombarda]
MAEKLTSAKAGESFALESFPTLKPAFRLITHFNERIQCGDIAAGETLVAVPLKSGGTVVSVGDYEPKVKFTIHSSTDFFTVDNDKQTGRIDAQAILLDEEGRAVHFINKGQTELNEETIPHLLGTPGAESSKWGNAIEYIRFRSGHPEYKMLERRLFVGSQRFIYLDGVHTGIELRMAEVIAGTGAD